MGEARLRAWQLFRLLYIHVQREFQCPARDQLTIVVINKHRSAQLNGAHLSLGMDWKNILCRYVVSHDKPSLAALQGSIFRSRRRSGGLERDLDTEHQW